MKLVIIQQSNQNVLRKTCFMEVELIHLPAHHHSLDVKLLVYLRPIV